MRTCPHCGSPATGAKTCQFCGKALGASGEPDRQDSQTSEQELADQRLLGGGSDPDSGGSRDSEQELADQFLLGGPPKPDKSQQTPKHKSLAGVWRAQDGSGFNITGTGPQFQLIELHPMAGPVGKGVATIQGNTVVIQSQNNFAGPWSAQLQLSGNTMSGTMLGFPVRFTR